MRLFAILLAAAAFGQNSGTIAGTVLDIDGQTVANAPVQALSGATKARWPRCRRAYMTFRLTRQASTRSSRRT
jgi:hypothetical protein